MVLIQHPASDRILKMTDTHKPYIVGITGGSASGKTHFLRSLMAAFPSDQVCLVSQDNYYRDIDQQPKDREGIENFDMPESIDHELYSDHIKTLVSGKEVVVKEYNFNNATAPDTFITYNPAPVIIVEGIFVFHFREVANMLDLRLFVDATEMVKIKRRIIRDNRERGYDLDDVLYRYEHHVNPTYRQFIEPYKDKADLIVPNNHNYDKALGVIVGHLQHEIQKRQPK